MKFTYMAPHTSTDLQFAAVHPPTQLLQTLVSRPSPPRPSAALRVVRLVSRAAAPTHHPYHVGRWSTREQTGSAHNHQTLQSATEVGVFLQARRCAAHLV
eukprot:GHUV01036418.1.p1 GENE.GHUV01036418.1~~GHUV01036418.1.p1  ORF type:complete len:100 (+),score=15.07 GHUV01036418.1:672-971(+)